MKKLSLAVAITAAVSAGAAQAYTLAEPNAGVLVPWATFEGDTSTFVGLVNHSEEDITVYWTFFDEDSTHITDGQFDMTGNDMEGFDWSEEAGFGLEGEIGYLVFAVGTDDSDDTLDSTGLISANAFLVDPAANDVAYVPTFPLDDTDFGDTALATLDADSIVDLDAGADNGDVVTMRYFIDGAAGGNDTSIVVWSANYIAGTYTVNMYNDDQDRKSVNFELANEELNVIDPETIVGRPAGFTDGFIRWTVPAGTDSNGDAPDPADNGVVSFSVVESQALGAAQTLLNAHETIN